MGESCAYVQNHSIIVWKCTAQGLGWVPSLPCLPYKMCLINIEKKKQKGPFQENMYS